MKKTPLLFVLVGAIALNVDAQTQPPNAGFETWVAVDTTENPTGWSSFNNFNSYGVPELSFKTTDKHSGTYALRLISDTVTLPPPLGTNILDTLAGYVFLGAPDMDHPGIPFTDRPKVIKAFVKGTIIAGSEAYLTATLSKWNTSTHVRDQVAFAMYYTSSSITNYTLISATFNYSLFVIPDTLDIKIMAGNVGPGGTIMPGNEFFIDDIYLGSDSAYYSTIAFAAGVKSVDTTYFINKGIKSVDTTYYINKGVKSVDTVKIYNNGVTAGKATCQNKSAVYNADISVYPNPTNGLIFLQGDDIFRTDITDINGKSAGTQYGKSINLSALADGTYILKIYDSSGNIIQTEQIQLIK